MIKFGGVFNMITLLSVCSTITSPGGSDTPVTEPDLSVVVACTHVFLGNVICADDMVRSSFILLYTINDILHIALLHS